MRVCTNSVSAAVAACCAVLLTCALLPRIGYAQAPSPGVFSTLQTDLVRDIGIALEPATMRSRVVSVDTPQVTAARLGQEALRLNLFDDAIVDVRIDRVRPTRSGYFITGRPEGFEWGEVRLVVNGPVMVGTVVTPEATFTIRWDGSGRHVIRQVDPSQELIEDDDVDNDLAPAAPTQAGPPVDPLSSPRIPATHFPGDTPTEDGSQVRVLVVYTPAMQARQGGSAGMQALIDLMIHSANQAFEISGIEPRLVLAHAALVNYVEEHPHIELSRLTGRDDGYMDEVHALRDKHAADLVHLLTSTFRGPAGTAGRISRESLVQENYAAFAVTATGREETFTHEIGHNFGLRHDRFVNSVVSAIFPYAFGYVNNRAFEPDATVETRWRTVMAYQNRCSNAGFGCPRLLRFSNPEQTYRGDPLGVPADDPATGPEGPADARLTINRSAPWVGSFRSEACTDFSVSPDAVVAPVGGGEIVLKVETAPGCIWEASSQSGFLAAPSDARHAGTRFVSINVEANETGAERIGTLGVADTSIEVRQLATDAGICSRTAAVVRAIAKQQPCDEVTDEQLSQIERLSLNGQGLTSLKAGDFAGLTGLELLSLGSNQLAELPEDLFAGLASVKFLYLGYNRLTQLPEGLFAGLSSLEALRFESNQLSELPGGLFAGLSNLRVLELDHNSLTQLSQNQFADLANLEELELNSNDLSTLPDGLFVGLGQLESLILAHNRLGGLPSRPFTGLSELQTLDLSHNRLPELPASAFAGLPRLKTLQLDGNPFTSLPAGLFAGLAELEYLGFWNAKLTELPAGVFAGLSNLTNLDLFSNDLGELPPGLFAGLSRLSYLRIARNELTSLPGGIFSGLTNLSELNLYGNRLSSLPDGVFAGLDSLEKLYLRGNRVDPLPLSVSLEKVGNNQFKAVAPAGAPFALPVPVSSDGGTIEGNAVTVTIPTGAVESSPIGVARVAGAIQRVTVDIGTLPALPGTHTGYVFEKYQGLPLSVLPSIDGADATLSGLSLSDGTLDPGFAPETTSYEASVPDAVSSITVTPETSNANAAAAIHDANDAALPDADTNADGHQVNLSPGDNVIKVVVTAEDDTAVQTYTLVVTREASICNRTVEVVDAIVQAVFGIDSCSDVSNAHLAQLTTLDLSGRDISSLQSGDFAGLSALEELLLSDNRLTALPADIFSGLVSLQSLRLHGNQLTAVPADVFADLSALEVLGLRDNHLESLPASLLSGLSELRLLYLSNNRLGGLPNGIFSGLSKLEELWLHENRIASLPASSFSGLTSLHSLLLNHNELTNLPADVFGGLSALRSLWLHENALASVPSGVFSGLSSLTRLLLDGNELTNLPADVFGGLTALELITLQNNALTNLPAGVFSGLSSLQRLRLGNNRLTALPDGLFAGLTNIRELSLERNTRDPLPLVVSLEKVGDNQFKAVAPVGAPFVLSVPVSASSSGAIEGDVERVAIPIGAVESAPVGVTRVAGASEAVTVDIGALPGLVGGHSGYIPLKDSSLPLALFPSLEPADAALSSLSLSDGTLDPVFDPDTTSYTASVPHAVTSITVSATPNDPQATLAYFDADDQALADADSVTEGYQANLVVGDNTIKVRVASGDETATQTYVIVVTRAAAAATGGICSRTPQVRDAIVAAVTGVSTCADVTDSHLAGITLLDLSNRSISSLQSGDFAGLTALEELRLRDNRLTVLPDGLFAGLSNLGTLTLGSNTVDPMPLTVSLQRVGNNQFKAVAPTGAPFALAVPVSSAGGTIDGSATTVTIPAGAVESTAVGVSRAPSDNDAVTVDIGALPALPGAHSGYVLEKGAGLPLTVLPPRQSSDTSLSGLSLSDGTLDPVFDPDMSSYTASVPHAVATITVNATSNDPRATLRYVGADNQALPDVDANRDGHQVGLSSGDNVIRVSVTSEDGTLVRRYTIVMTREASICERTGAVVAAIVHAVSGVDSCGYVTSAHLAGITLLDLSARGITSLQSGDFLGLSALQTLRLNGNRLTALPADVFSMLVTLETLSLANNRLESLPVAVLSRLAALRFLYLSANRLTSLPNGTLAGLSKLEVLRLHNNRIGSLRANAFSGLSSLEELRLSDNGLTGLPSGVFSGLSSLEELRLNGNQLTSLAAGLFSGLSALQTLELHSNRLSTLPDGLFAGLTNLGTLTLGSNTVNPMVLSVSLEKAGNNRFRAVAPTGAVFALELPLSVSGAAAIEGGANSITVPAGAVESVSLSVTRTSQAGSAVTVDIGTLPSLPGAHSGYVFAKDASLPLTVLPSLGSSETRLSDLSLSDGTLDPVFNPDTSSYTASVPNAVASITVTPATSNQNATAAFRDASDAALPDADANMDGHQISLSSGENVIKVVVTAENRTSIRTYTLVMTREASICNRTSQVVDAIVQAVSGLDSCGYVSKAQLAGITTLDLSRQSITSLQSGDFADLSALQTLHLYGNQLTALPADVFAGLAALDTLSLWQNRLESLPANVFSGLAALRQLGLDRNRLSGLPAGIFSGLSRLEALILSNNRISSLPANVFSGLSSLEALHLSSNELTSLPANVFSGLSALTDLQINVNSLTNLPAGAFANLSALQTLFLNHNELTSLRADDFAGLSALQNLWLQSNAFTSLPAGLLSGLSALQQLNLRGNRLSALPNGFFSGLTNLRSLDLQENLARPIPVPVSLEKVGASQFKAVAPTGAPFAFELSLSVSSGGAIGGAADSVTIPAGAVESASLSVTRTAEAGPAVTVDIGALPALPASHHGYALAKDATLPRTILQAKRAATPAQVTGVELTPGVELLEVSWTAVSDAGGYKVQWKSGAEDYADARQSLITSGATTSHTITGLTAGTEYTVRVIATKEFADDGSASNELKGTPRAAAPGKVTGLEVTAGTNRLVVSWTAVSGADGYKVQWKSGEEDYADARQAAISSGGATSHTITGLTAGTVYTVRLIATKATTDDGPASDEVTATPITVAVLNSLSLSDGTLAPTFASDTTRYTASVANAVASVTVTRTTNHANATVAFLDGNDAALSDADTDADGHQVSLDTGENVFKVKVTAEDGASTRTYTIVMTREASICNRTDAVVDAIVEAVSGVDACGYVSSAHLAGITTLDLAEQNISALNSGDFAGLSSLQKLSLSGNQLTTLPASVFSGLSALRLLYLTDNQLSGLPGGIFSGLSKLEEIWLYENRIASLPASTFSGLSSLRSILLNGNELTSLSADTFSGLSALQSLWLHDNSLASLPADMFSGLSSLRKLLLSGNRLTSLPADVFSGLSSLNELWLQGIGLTSLRADAFSGLSSLHTLWLGNNALTRIPAGVFSGLSALQRLGLGNNSLSTLPDGLFSGLTGLSHLGLYGNSANPMPLSVSLEKVGANQFKAVAPTGAPFALTLPVSSAGGMIAGGVSSVSIPAGGVASASIGVSRAAGDTDALTVDIGTLPDLPSGHLGYELQKGAPLPLEILMARAAQVTGVTVTAGTESLEVTWTAVTDADGYKVQWKSGDQAYDDTRQAEVTGGDTVSYTISGLTAGAEYTVRVIATEEGADDGTPSAEVSATPDSTSPDMTGLGRVDGNDALIMYHSYAYPDRVGNGRTGGTAALRERYLAGYSGKTDPGDEELREMVRKAYAWRSAGVDQGGDINGDGMIDASDARAMYHAYTDESLLGDGAHGGAVRFRAQFLGPLAGNADPTDEDLKAMLRRANELREEFTQ